MACPDGAWTSSEPVASAVFYRYPICISRACKSCCHTIRALFRNHDKKIQNMCNTCPKSIRQVAQVVVDRGRQAIQDYFLNDLSLSEFWACPSKVIHEVVAQFQKLTQFRSVLVFLATKAEIRKWAAALSDTLTVETSSE